MKDGLREKIRALGHWRVNIRPLGAVKPLRLVECKEVVKRCAVSIRGWDFPHLSHRNDDQGGEANVGDYYENWTDWNGFYEFWRMYKSKQFVFYTALHEDTPDWAEGHPIGTVVNSIMTEYSIFEFVEFCHRMHKDGTYVDGLTIEIGLHNAAGRELVAGRNRVPFFGDKRNEADVIKVSRKFLPNELLLSHKKAAVDMCIDFFDHFGWSPESAQITNDQDKFYNRMFSA